jgi:DNA polymerase III alpha subunit
MITNTFGQSVYSEKDLIDLYMTNPELTLRNTLTDTKIEFDPDLELNIIPELIKHELKQISVEEFDTITRNNWFMPKTYQNLDIAEWLLKQCNHPDELQRVGKELLMYQKRGLFPLLQYMKYLVDLMRKHDIVWGVGRGSSVSSFVLFLLGIHRINSLYYDLDIEEFLK